MRNFDILATFLSLTSKTYPAGTEQQLKKFLPKEIQMDKAGNYFIKIGESETAFTCHLDTCSYEQDPVTHELLENGYVRTDGYTILGADDKAGMTILLYMIHHQIPGLYYFFIEEEIGGIGSRNALIHHKDFFENYKRMISFDRRGTSDVITHQRGIRCCSDEFAFVLSERLNEKGLSYKPSAEGVFTDSDRFKEVIPECTNVSVGYYDEHTENEHQDIVHLEKLAKACISIDWEALPSVRF